MSTQKTEVMDELRAELEAVKASSSTNRLTADAVVEFAKQAHTALHSHFEWDDSIAGHKHRIEQARQIIASIRIEVRTEFRKIESVFYVRDPNAAAKEQGYVSITDLRSDAEMARDALVNEFISVRALLTRARNIAATLGMEDRVDALMNEVNVITRMAREQPVTIAQTT